MTERDKALHGLYALGAAAPCPPGRSGHASVPCRLRRVVRAGANPGAALAHLKRLRAGGLRTGKVLEEERSSRIRAFVVWEPVLWTDLSPPSTRRLASISDARVAQDWDPEHVVSAAVISSAWAAKDVLSTQGAKVGRKRVAWDLVLLFPPRSCEGGALPEPVFHGDPVVTTMNELRDHLRVLVHR